MITNIKGSLLDDPTVDVVCHQVNCQGKMGSGIAKSIRDKWPIVFERYSQWHKSCAQQAYMISQHPEWGCDPQPMLGKVQIVQVSETQHVANLAGQEFYGYDGSQYTSYDAFWSCLHDLRNAVQPTDIIGFPKGIGCGLGGANWNIIEKMIDEVFKDYNVKIYQLEDEHEKNGY